MTDPDRAPGQHADSADGAGDDPVPDDGTGLSPRWRAVLGVALAVLAVAFVASVVRSTLSSSMPVPTSTAMPRITANGTMPGMTMNTDRLAMTLRDVHGRAVRIPAGRQGAIVFARAPQCDPCVTAARIARDAVRDATPRAQVIVVMLSSSTSREAVTAFARSVGPGRVRYVIDNPDDRVAAMFDVSTLGGTVVYDARGHIVATLQPGSRQIARYLQHDGAR